ncbi:DUF7344 domain-containing protein [Haloarcula marina]|uniref:DUF7344 domain-containing protein n=1 Tax=Haloarcula marina TaxID=2961574 RepID=UPI0020B72790|nr:hypothetical protein [Halomicroarcula marina]
MSDTESPPAGPNAVSTAASPDRSGPDQSGRESLPLGTVFDVLKNDRRRHAVRFLLDAADETSVGSLSEHVAAIEQGTTADAVTQKQRKRVYVSLHQCHLPKMDKLAVVEFDRDGGTVRAGTAAADLAPYLDHEFDDRTPWYRYYAGITIVGAVLFAATAATPLLPLSAVCTGLLLAVGVCAGLHYKAERRR